jgi:dTDP-4-dehydrorhamnose reductase
MKYLIAGKKGQLARAFIERFERNGTDFLAPGEEDLDITNQEKVLDVIGRSKPDFILNCAAYNLVDRAEDEPEKAFAVNADGPGALAAAARRYGSFLVHYSSDYVFDGLKENGLYDESDSPNPLNQYGKSKLAGERVVQEETEKALILRLSWVFGEGRQNFIAKLIEWTEKSEYLKITCDEFSVPTYTETVVDITLNALEKGISGLYHLTSSGFCSRYEWAKLILSSAGIKKFIRPVPMDAFLLPAKRPNFSAMSNTAISGLLNVEIASWEESVVSFIQKYGLRHGSES